MIMSSVSQNGLGTGGVATHREEDDAHKCNKDGYQQMNRKLFESRVDRIQQLLWD